jgi:hypothetical protein
MGRRVFVKITVIRMKKTTLDQLKPCKEYKKSEKGRFLDSYIADC